MKFTYTGPPSSVTLNSGQCVHLPPGGEVDMPETHPYTQTLTAMGYLKPVKPVVEVVTVGRTKAVKSTKGGK